MFPKFKVIAIFFGCVSVLVIPSFASASTINVPVVNNLGLVGYWTLDGKDTNWNSMTTSDASGNGNTAIMANLSTTSSPTGGKVGQALNFNGTTQYVSVSNTTGSIDLTGNKITLSAWVKGTSPGTYKGIAVKDNGGGADGYGMYTGSYGNLEFFVGVGTFQSSGDIGNIIWDGSWHHVVGVYDGAHVTLYMDGIQKVQSGSVTANIADSPPDHLTIGAFDSSQVYGFPGSIDDVRVYNRALSANEIRGLYSAGATQYNVAPKTALSNGLVGYWTLDGKDTNWTTMVTKDISGSGFDGSVALFSTTTAPTSGKIGQALNFDSSVPQRITISSTASVLNQGSGPYSVSGWIYSTNVSACPGGSDACAFLSSIGNGGNGDVGDFFIGLGSGSLIRFANWRSSGTNIDNATVDAAGVGYIPIVNNKWYHVVGTWDGSVNKIYVNGVLQPQSALGFTGAGDTVGAYIGGFYPLTQYMWNGKIDDVRLYNRALSATEVKQLYSIGATTYNTSSATSTSIGLSNGLVGYWTLDGKDTDWNSMTTNDVSGNGNTGTMVGLSTSSSPTAGKVGQALTFNGTDYTEVPHNSVLSFADNFSVGAWVKPAIAASQMIVSKRDSGSFNNNYQLYLNSDSTVTFQINGTNPDYVQLQSALNVNPNYWNYVMGVVRNGTMYIYVNGVQDANTSTLPSGTITETGPLRIGENHDLNQGFTGRIDDVRIYNRALSAKEVLQLYNMGK